MAVIDTIATPIATISHSRKVVLLPVKSIYSNVFSEFVSVFCNIEVAPSAKNTSKVTIGLSNVPPISAFTFFGAIT